MTLDERPLSFAPWLGGLIGAGGVNFSPSGEAIIDPKVRDIIAALHATLSGFPVETNIRKTKSPHFEELEFLFESAWADVRDNLDNPRSVLRVTDGLARYHKRAARCQGADPISIGTYIFHARNTTDDGASKLAAAWTFRLAADELNSLPSSGDAALQCMSLSLNALRDALDGASDDTCWRRHAQLLCSPSWYCLDAGDDPDFPGLPEDVIERYAQNHTAGHAAAAAAYHAGCSEEDIEHYKTAANQTQIMVRIQEDMRCFFGPVIEEMQNRVNMLVACFEAVASESNRLLLRSLILERAHGRARRLFYESGAVDRLAEHMDRCRSEIHRAIAATGQASGGHRMWLHAVDSIAGKLFSVKVLRTSRYIQQPEGGKHEDIVGAANSVMGILVDLGLPDPPPLLPWHLPQWMYDFQRNVVLYPDPDLEEYEDSILGFYGTLLAEKDTAYLRDFVRQSNPIVLSHELFHYWRYASGNMTQDFWYEEWVASALVAALINARFPDRQPYLKMLSDRLLEIHGHLAGASGRNLVNELFEPDYCPATARKSYGFEMMQIAVIQALMTTRFCDNPPDLEESLDRFCRSTIKGAEK